MALNESYYQTISNQVLQSHNELKTEADTWGQTTLNFMNSLATEANTRMGILDTVVFSPDFVDNLNFSALSGTEPTYATEPDYSSEGPEAPTLNSVAPTIAAFDFTDTAYTGLVKTAMTNSINDVLGGTNLLPSAVIDAMYDRLIADLAREQVAEEFEGSDNGAANGWTLPSESTLAAIADTQEQTSRKTQTARLEHYIQEWVNKQKDMYQAWQTGPVHEKAWMDDHHRVQDRALQKAIKTVDSAREVFQIGIAYDNLQLQKYSIQWDSLSKRWNAAAQMFQARVANSRVGLESEQTRFSYENKKVDKSLAVEQGETQLAVERAKLVVENALGTLAQLMQTAANIAMALMSAQDVGLSTGTSFSANESHDYKEKCCE